MAVSVTMLVVLALTSGFVYWRVTLALNSQMARDLHGYRDLVQRALQNGTRPVEDTPGELYQEYDLDGRIIGGATHPRLADREGIARAARGRLQVDNVGRLISFKKGIALGPGPYRVVTARTRTPGGPVVVAYAISGNERDEALGELLALLAIAGLLTLAASSAVGYGTARAALRPVERYRVAAASAATEEGVVLPVPRGDDELTRLGHTFNDLLTRLARSNARERRFLADASHELRSPLTVMRTELEWALMRAHEDADNRESLESLQGQVLRLITLCNTLLELEELRAPDEPLNEEVDLATLARGTVDRARATAEARGRELRVEAPDPVLVEGRSHWLELALGNLVTNALRHGTGEVTVTVAERPDHAEVAVSDEGSGFPPGFVERAFDRFSRAEESRSTRGTGLGLALVKAIVDTHGGTATIHGSTVTLVLPVVRPPARRTPV